MQSAPDIYGHNVFSSICDFTPLMGHQHAPIHPACEQVWTDISLLNYQNIDLNWAGFTPFSPAWALFSMGVCWVSCSGLCPRHPAAILTSADGSREPSHHSLQTGSFVFAVIPRVPPGVGLVKMR